TPRDTRGQPTHRKSLCLGSIPRKLAWEGILYGLSRRILCLVVFDGQRCIIPSESVLHLLHSSVLRHAPSNMTPTWTRRRTRYNALQRGATRRPPYNCKFGLAQARFGTHAQRWRGRDSQPGG